MNMELVEILRDEVRMINEPIKFMEVCGTHTMEIGKMGLRDFLGERVRLISGPGCPVCVTPSLYIDYIYDLALIKKISIITYGDMMRIPGTSPNISLEKAKALGADIRIVYSPIDSINISEEDKNNEFVFIGIGFETTIPSTAVLIEEIINKKINNLKVLSIHKRVEPVMRSLIKDKNLKLDGFLCPGNVGVIIGEDGFKFIEEEKQLGVIGGFSEDEIISSIINLIRCTRMNKSGVINNYKRFVSKEGNIVAKELINKYFILEKSDWRGIGSIDNSGFSIKNEFRRVDISETYKIDRKVKSTKGKSKKYTCRCGEILKGSISPKECESFANICTPTFPIGPCMVSSEGTCSAYYKYERR